MILDRAGRKIPALGGVEGATLSGVEVDKAKSEGNFLMVPK